MHASIHTYIVLSGRQCYAEELRHLPRLITPATVALECAVVALGRVRVLQVRSLARDGSYAYGIVLIGLL